MKNPFRQFALPLGSAVLLAVAAALPAAASDGQDMYRCRVLGDGSACPVSPPAGEPVVQTVPGSYARYLIHNGRPFDQAIADARATGEEPSVRVVLRPPVHQLSGFGAYERINGRVLGPGARLQIPFVDSWLIILCHSAPLWRAANLVPLCPVRKFCGPASYIPRLTFLWLAPVRAFRSAELF